jgi:hypothetical protein
VDKFRGRLALKSLFSALSEIIPKNTEYAKLVEIVSDKPILVDIHMWWRNKC